MAGHIDYLGGNKLDDRDYIAIMVDHGMDFGRSANSWQCPSNAIAVVCHTAEPNVLSADTLIL